MLSTTGGKLKGSVTSDFLPVSSAAEYDRDATASGLLQKARLRTHQEAPTWHPRAKRVEDRRLVGIRFRTSREFEVSGRSSVAG